MTWPFWLLLAGVALIGVEFVNRTAPSNGTWFDVLPITAPLVVFAQLGLYYGYRDAPSWYLAWVVFALGTQVFRAGSVALTAPGEVSSWPSVALGIGVVFTGGWLVKRGLAG